MNAIDVRNLSKKFIISHEKEALVRSILPAIFRPAYKEELWALKDISFCLKKGESLGVIGPNGAGKSVLLNILAGITALSQGDVKLSGKVSTILTLGAGFHYELTGEENIFLNATILGMSVKEIRQKFDSMVDFSGLDGFIDAPIQTYSMGMLLRLGFSIATHMDFDILLVDEIIGVGDLQFREKSLNKLKEFRDKGKTIILASQALDLVKEITDKTIYLKKGIIEGFGDSDSITKVYKESIKNKASVLLDKEHISRIIEERKREQSPERVRSSWGLKTGTKEAEIVEVRLLDRNKGERHEFATGESIEIEVKYRINKEIIDPHFGVAIFREDKLYCYGPNTRFDDLAIAKLMPGEGRFSIYYPRFLLSSGTYFLSVAIWEKAEKYAYDYHSAFYKMRVTGEDCTHLFYQPYTINMEGIKNTDDTLNTAGYAIKAKITDKYGKEKDVFKTEETLKISADISHNKKVSDLFIRIYTDDDVLCFSMHKKLKLSLMWNRTKRVEFKVPELNLLTGRYYIWAEIMNKNGKSLMHEKRLKGFTVFSEKKDHGIVYINHKWNLGGIIHEAYK